MSQVIKVEFPNHFKPVREPMAVSDLDTLIDDIDAAIESDYEYNTENEDCPLADFVESFFYGEADSTEVFKAVEDLIDLEAKNYNPKYFNTNQAGRLIRQLKKLKESSDSEFFDFLGSYCTVEPYSNYWPGTDSILSQGLGETEFQLSDDLEDRLNLLNEADLKYVKDTIDGHMSGSDFVCYSADGNGWCLVFDPETLVETWKNNGEKLP